MHNSLVIVMFTNIKFGEDEKILIKKTCQLRQLHHDRVKAKGRRFENSL